MAKLGKKNATAGNEVFRLSGLGKNRQGQDCQRFTPVFGRFFLKSAFEPAIPKGAVGPKVFW
jgi:hypothetical protein